MSSGGTESSERHPVMENAEYTWVQQTGPPVPLSLDILSKKKAVLDSLNLALTQTEQMDAYLSPPETTDTTNEPTEKKTESQGNKQPCAACGKTRNNRVYCYDCLIPLNGVDLPKLAPLPVKLVVIRHPTEKRSKSSALHAQVLAGKDQAETYETPLPDTLTFDKDTTCVIFPGEDSVAVEDLPNLNKLKTVVVLDSQWSKAKGLNRLVPLKGIPRIHLKEYKTFFWRYQRFPDTYLATIEAIYYFYVEYFNAAMSRTVTEGDRAKSQRIAYDGRFDNLLAIYAAQFRKIYRQEIEYVKNKK